MASKRLKEDQPPSTTSGEEEESDDDAVSEEVEEENEKSEDEQVEEEDDEEEEETSPARKPTVNTLYSSKVVSKPQSSSGSETESGWASDSEKSPPSPSASDFTIKPIKSKPMAEAPMPKKPNNNNSTPIPVSRSSSTRAAETYLSNTKDPKKRKVSSSSTTNGDDEDSKKPFGPVQRLWSEEDELAVLNGMIEYESKKGSDPYADMGAFHEFMKKKLHVEVSKAQLMDKIRRMKKKYRTNFEKGGEDMIFSKPHEHKSFELSKKIWGNEANNKNEPPSNRKGRATNGNSLALPKQEVVLGAKKEGLDNGEVKGTDGRMEEFWASIPCLNAASETMAEMGCLALGKRSTREFIVGIGIAKARELENRGRKVREAELEVYVKRTEFLHELGKLMLETKKKRA